MADTTEDSSNDSSPLVGERDQNYDEQKNKLIQQIRELKSIILQMECNLDLLKFGNAKCNLHSNTTESQEMGEISNVNVQLQNHLYRYSGFHCVKFTKKEYIFNFSPSKKYDKKNTFAVQILNRQDSGVLGKWVMPPGIDLNNLESQVSINNLKTVPRFLRTCKHYVDCYFIRNEQYALLMDVSSHIKNCSIQRNEEYTQVILDLMGVYDEDNNSYMNLMVYLFYHINETRPYKVVVDSMEKVMLDKHVKKCIEKSLTCFKNLDLHIAFGNILNEGPFVWTREDDEDSPLPVDTASSSDEEGFLDSFTVRQKRSPNLSQRRKRRRKNTNIRAVSKDFEMFVGDQSKKRPRKTFNRHSIADQNSDAIQSMSNMNNTKRRKLRQSKLNFLPTSSTLHTSANLLCLEPSMPTNKEVNRKTNKLFTSTPKPSDREHSANSIASMNVDISNIVVDSNKLDYTTEKTGSIEKDQSQNGTSRRLLHRKMKKKVKHLNPENMT